MARFIVALHDSQVAATVKALLPHIPGNVRLIEEPRTPGSSRFSIEATAAEAADLQAIIAGIGVVERDELLPPPGPPVPHPKT